jgi:hypothetical protein
MPGPKRSDAKEGGRNDRLTSESAMTPEEFERLKAKERAHLEKLRELKQAVKQLEHQRSVVSALDHMRTGATGLLDEQARLVEDLARDTAFMEAKAEMASADLDVEPSVSDEELQRIRAQQLVERIKAEDLAITDSAPPEGPARQTQSPETPAIQPEKTIGRMRRT